MQHISAEDLQALKVRELGLDPSCLDLVSIEALATALRRAASLLCPCPAPTLLRSVLDPLDGLASDPKAVAALAESTLEALVGYGDVLELGDLQPTCSKSERRVLFLAPPSFVLRQTGMALIVGIAPDTVSPLPEGIASRVKYVNHVRRLSAAADEDLRAELGRLGLLELSPELWLKAPPHETAAEHIQRLDRVLDSASPSTEIPGLQLLDPTRPVNYYRGRWVELHKQTGRFVARRPQAYGAPLWCYVEVQTGSPKRFIDLPLAGSRLRGSDEAWRLQMAIDALRGRPQRFSLRPGPPGTGILALFSPLPTWAQRRWDAIGENVPAPGCLFAYRFTRDEISEEVRFAREVLWLEGPEPGGESQQRTR